MKFSKVSVAIALAVVMSLSLFTSGVFAQRVVPGTIHQATHVNIVCTRPYRAVRVYQNGVWVVVCRR